MRRLTLRTVLVLAGTAALSAVAPMPVAAHAELILTTPAAGVSLPEAPTQLMMSFSEAIDPITASVTLLDETGTSVRGLGTLTVDSSATVASVTLPPLPASLYTVLYRVTSAEDGHITQGSWLFLVDPTGTRAAPGSSVESSSPSSTPLIVATRWLALAFGLVLLGTAVFWLASARPALASGNADATLATAPWLWLAACAALAFTGLAAYLTLAAQPLTGGAGHPGHGGGIVPLDFAAPFGATRFAMAMRVALVGSGAAFLLGVARHFTLDESRRRGRLPRDREGGILVLVAGAAAISLAGSSFASHAAAAGGVLFGLFDWLHLVAVAVWLGTLAGLFVLLRRTRALPDRSVALGALRRHSRIAIVAAPIVVATGLANSPLVLGSARNLVATDYGDLLLAKALLFSTAIAIGSANYFLVRAGAVRRVLPLIAGEAAIGALAVVVAAILVSTQPAASRAPEVSRPAIGAEQLFADVADSTIHVSINRPSPGVQRYQATVSDLRTGIPRTELDGITLVFTEPQMASGSEPRSQRVALTRSSEHWLWGATGNYTPLSGIWTLGIEVERAAQPLATSFTLNVEPAPEPEVLPPAANGVSVPAPLALAWSVLPKGAVGWLVPIVLLLAVAALAARERRGRGFATGGWRVGLVLLVLASGVTMGSRAAVEAANQPPSEATQRANPIRSTADSIARGRSLYLANCSSCHGPNGAGDGPGAARLLPSPGTLAGSVPHLSAGALNYRITNGMVVTSMPAFASSLTENDRWDLVNYLRATWPSEGEP